MSTENFEITYKDIPAMLFIAMPIMVTFYLVVIFRIFIYIIFEYPFDYYKCKKIIKEGDFCNLCCKNH